MTKKVKTFANRIDGSPSDIEELGLDLIRVVAEDETGSRIAGNIITDNHKNADGNNVCYFSAHLCLSGVLIRSGIITTNGDDDACYQQAHKEALKAFKSHVETIDFEKYNMNYVDGIECDYQLASKQRS